MLDKIKNIPRSIETYLLGNKKENELTISEKHQQLLINHGLTPVKVIRLAEFHDVIMRSLTGADVVKCTDGNGVELVAHLTDGVFSGKTLKAEARITRTVAGIEYLSDDGWAVKFPESVRLEKEGKSTLTVYPFYQGDNGETFTKQYDDDDLTAVSMAVLTGLEAMYQQLDPAQIKILEANGQKMQPLLTAGRYIISQWLIMKSVLTSQEVTGLLSMQKRGNEMAQGSKSRLIHRDLHTFNVIPNPDTRNIAVVDLAMLSAGQSFSDFGRWLIFLLIADRKEAMVQLEDSLVHKGIIDREGIQCAKAGALLDWGSELFQRPKAEDDVILQRVEAGKRLWKEEVNLLLKKPVER